MSFRRKRMQKATTMLKTATPRERDGADLVLHGLRRFSCGGAFFFNFADGELIGGRAMAGRLTCCVPSGGQSMGSMPSLATEMEPFLTGLQG